MRFFECFVDGGLEFDRLLLLDLSWGFVEAEWLG